MTLKPSESVADADDRMTLLDVAIALARRWQWLAFLPLAVGVITLGVAFLMTPVFTARAQLLPPQQQGGAAAALLGAVGGGAAVLGSGLGLTRSSVDQYLGLLRSQTVLDAMVDRFGLVDLYQADYRFQARNRLADNTDLSTGKDGLIAIEVVDESPERAAQMVQAYIDELQRLSDTLAVTEAAQRRLFFEKRLKEARAALEESEGALRAVGVSPDVLKTNPEVTLENVARVQAAVAEQEVRVHVMREWMAEKNPELQAAISELASLRAQLKKTENSAPAAGSAGVAQYAERYRDYKYNETLFEIFARQYEAARADEAREGSTFQVVDKPSIPEYKSAPKRGLMAVLATLLTFMVCATVVLLKEAIRRTGLNPAGRSKLADLSDALSLRRRR